MRAILLVLATLATVTLVPAPVPAAGATHVVHVVDSAYEDLETGTPITVAAVGDTVQWVWTDALRHTVTEGVNGAAGGAAFHSGVRSAGPEGTFVHTFDAPGVYVYHCTLHVSMRGIVVVQ